MIQIGFSFGSHYAQSWFLCESHGLVFFRFLLFLEQVARPALQGSVAVLNQAFLTWARTFVQIHQAWFFICFNFQRAKALCMPTRFVSHWISIGYRMFPFRCHVHGFPAIHMWIPKGLPLDLHCRFQCTLVPFHGGARWMSIGLPLAARGIPMGFPWHSNWIPIALSTGTLCISMGCPFDFH